MGNFLHIALVWIAVRRGKLCILLNNTNISRHIRVSNKDLYVWKTMWIFTCTPYNNGRNFGVRRVLKGGETHNVIIMCLLLIFLPNFVSLMHIGSSLPL